MILLLLGSITQTLVSRRAEKGGGNGPGSPLKFTKSPFKRTTTTLKFLVTMSIIALKIKNVPGKQQQQQQKCSPETHALKHGEWFSNAYNCTQFYRT